MDWYVNALTVYDTKLVVGGAFSTAGGKASAYLASWTKGSPADAGEDRTTLPAHWTLSQNYPNPFNPSTTFEYSLPSPSRVAIDIFNIMGRRVRVLVQETKPAGVYRIDWNGTDQTGEPVASGVYVYRLQTDGHVETRRMLLLK